MRAATRWAWTCENKGHWKRLLQKLWRVSLISVVPKFSIRTKVAATTLHVSSQMLSRVCMEAETTTLDRVVPRRVPALVVALEICLYCFARDACRAENYDRKWNVKSCVLFVDLSSFNRTVYVFFWLFDWVQWLPWLQLIQCLVTGSHVMLNTILIGYKLCYGRQEWSRVGSRFRVVGVRNFVMDLHTHKQRHQVVLQMVRTVHQSASGKIVGNQTIVDE